MLYKRRYNYENNITLELLKRYNKESKVINESEKLKEDDSSDLYKIDEYLTDAYNLLLDKYRKSLKMILIQNK